LFARQNEVLKKYAKNNENVLNSSEQDRFMLRFFSPVFRRAMLFTQDHVQNDPALFKENRMENIEGGCSFDRQETKVILDSA